MPRHSLRVVGSADGGRSAPERHTNGRKGQEHLERTIEVGVAQRLLILAEFEHGVEGTAVESEGRPVRVVAAVDIAICATQKA